MQNIELTLIHTISKCDGMHIWAKIIKERLHRILM
jgi:hypothetical protein